MELIETLEPESFSTTLEPTHLFPRPNLLSPHPPASGGLFSVMDSHVQTAADPPARKEPCKSKTEETVVISPLQTSSFYKNRCPEIQGHRANATSPGSQLGSALRPPPATTWPLPSPLFWKEGYRIENGFLLQPSLRALKSFTNLHHSLVMTTCFACCGPSKMYSLVGMGLNDLQ